MKIAYLSTFYPFRGGIAQFNAALFREFEKEHEIRAYNFTRQYPNILFPGKTQMVTEGDTADAIPNEAILDSANPITYLTAARKIKPFAPNLLVTKFWMPYFGPSLGTVSGRLRKKGTKSIAVLDNVIPHEKRPGDIQLIKYFLNRYDGFVCMSNAVKDDLLSLKPNANYILSPHPLYDHFPPKIDKAEARQKLGLPGGKKLLLYFGLIRGYKGLDLLIESLSKLPDEYELIIAGECYEDWNKYQAQIDNLGVGNRIHEHVRYIDDNDVPLFFSAADGNMLTYKTATQSGIVSIAYHFELPMLVTDVGGLRESVEPYGVGMTIDKPDVDLITKAIPSFIENISNYQSGFTQLKSQLTWSKLASDIIEFYKTL
ncbi:MAG: glycosyltransferase [Bacteroidetes bacterium]|nr:glycosyltransferase [Bacteroidota bacterium]